MFLLLVSLGAASGALAHPMGNFTVNHYSRLTATPAALRLHYVLDMAELPTISERQDMDKDGDGEASDQETRAYLANRTPKWLASLPASVDGKPLVWRLRRSNAVMTPGVANLPTLRIELDADAAWPTGTHQVSYEDRNYDSRPGWKEIVLDAAPGVPNPEGATAAKDLSHELRSYPTDLLADPPQVSSISFRITVPVAPAHRAVAKAVPATKPAPKPAPAVKPVSVAAPAPVAMPAPKPSTSSSPARPTVEAEQAPTPPTPPATAAPVRAGAPVRVAATPTPPARKPAVAPPAPAPQAAEPSAESPDSAPPAAPGSPESQRFQTLMTLLTIAPGAVLVAGIVLFRIRGAREERAAPEDATPRPPGQTRRP